MIKRKIGAAVLALLIGGGAFAQIAYDSTSDIESISLNLEQALEYATKNNRTLKSSDIDLEIKKRASDNAWNVFLPTVQLSGTMSRTNEFVPGTADILANAMSGGKVPVPTDYEKEEDRWKTLGSLSVSWTFSAAYIGQIKSAKVAYENGKISYEQSQKETLLNIKKLFYGLLVQQENLKIQKATLENKRQRMAQAQVSYKNGSLPELALLQAQVDYQNSKPNVDEAEQTMTQNLDTFAFLLGMPVGTKILLDGEINPKYVDVNVVDLLEQYGENDLSIKSLEGNIKALKLGVDTLNMSVWIPALAVNYAWQPVYTGSEGAFHFFGDIGSDDKWYDSGNLSLTLAWNLTNMLPWSKTQQQIKDYKQQLAQLNLTLETLKENQKVSVRKAVNTLKQAKLQIDAMGRTVVLAQQAYDSTFKRYRSGQTELLDLRDAETSLNQAKLGLLSQKYQYVSALMDLENILNTTLTLVEE